MRKRNYTKELAFKLLSSDSPFWGDTPTFKRAITLLRKQGHNVIYDKDSINYYIPEKLNNFWIKKLIKNEK